jgi:hypothetical protein
VYPPSSLGDLQVYATSVALDDGTSIYRVLLYGLAAEVGAMIIWYLAGFITLNLLIKQIKGASRHSRSAPRLRRFIATLQCPFACRGPVRGCADVLPSGWAFIPASSAAPPGRMTHDFTRLPAA